MFSLGNALSSFGGGFVDQLSQNEKDQAQKLKNKQAQFEMQGLEALGNAFRPDTGPQPPMPGQPSMPAQPPMPPNQPTPMPGPPMGGMPPAAPMAPGGAGPAGPALPGNSPGAGAPPAAPPGPPAAAGGMPQLDLPTLIQRIQAKNPNLPPQAMVYALNAAAPMLNAQAQMELRKLTAQMRGDELSLRRQSNDETRRYHDILTGQGAGATGTPAGRMSPDAIEGAAERYLKTGQFPPNLGRGSQGRLDMVAIQNKASEMARDRGIKPDDMMKGWQTFKAEQTAITRFMSGPQGNTIRSLGVVVDHLHTMQGFVDALNNGDIQLFNRLAQSFAEQTGSEAPTNLDTAKQIVGAEVIKALGVAGAGTQGERAEAADAFSRAKSPQQLAGAIKVAQKLLAGQLAGMKRQFRSSTGLKDEVFDRMLGEEGLFFLKGTEKGSGPKDVPKGGGAAGAENDPLGIR